MVALAVDAYQAQALNQAQAQAQAQAHSSSPKPHIDSSDSSDPSFITSHKSTSHSSDVNPSSVHSSASPTTLNIISLASTNNPKCPRRFASSSQLSQSSSCQTCSNSHHLIQSPRHLHSSNPTPSTQLQSTTANSTQFACCHVKKNDFKSLPPLSKQFPVYLNVYDVLITSDPNAIPRLNNVLVHCGLGVYHSGIEVHTKEYAFGGHIENTSGIFQVAPRQCPAVRFRTCIPLGHTHLSQHQVDRLIHSLGKSDYIGCRYSLITRNCNTFAQHFAKLLGVSERFPSWVNRLACFALNVRCLLPEPLLLPLSDVAPSSSTALIQEPQKPPRVASL